MPHLTPQQFYVCLSDAHATADKMLKENYVAADVKIGLELIRADLAKAMHELDRQAEDEP